MEYTYRERGGRERGGRKIEGGERGEGGGEEKGEGKDMHEKRHKMMYDESEFEQTLIYHYARHHLFLEHLPLPVVQGRVPLGEGVWVWPGRKTGRGGDETA